MQARLVDIPENEVLLYLGYRGQSIDQKLESQIKRCIQRVMQTSQPRLVYRIMDVKDAQIESLELEGSDLRDLLCTCDKAVVMAATLGSLAEDTLRKAEVTNMADAVIMDSAQSAAIENVCNCFEEDLQKELGQDHYLTDRFSPGYGDLPLQSQRQLMAAVDATRRIGLTLTPTDLMVPRKSVTCIIGISDKPQKRRKRGCETCSMFRTCAYRKEGRNCNG